MCCGSLMRTLGYQPIRTTASPLRVVWTWVTVPLALSRAFLVNRHRLGNPLDYVVRRARLAANRAGASGRGSPKVRGSRG